METPLSPSSFLPIPNGDPRSCPPSRLNPLHPMDELEDGHEAGPFEWSRKCICNKIFHQVNSYTNHINSCKKYKTSAGATLEEAKQRYRVRQSKKGKNRPAVSRYGDDELDIDIDYVPSAPTAPSSSNLLGTSIQVNSTENLSESIQRDSVGPPVSRFTWDPSIYSLSRLRIDLKSCVAGYQSADGSRPHRIRAWTSHPTSCSTLQRLCCNLHHPL